MKPNVKSLLGGAVAIVLIWAITAFAGGGTTTTDADFSSNEVAEATDRASSSPAGSVEDETTDLETASSGRFSDLPLVAPGELPIEAIDTLDLIASGGPFPYSKDDSVFQNREGILPDEGNGHYREYTVDTPGESDRGARRIVAGADGALYYTDDHYDSFREIVFGQ